MSGWLRLPEHANVLEVAAVFAALVSLWMLALIVWSMRRGRREERLRQRLGLTLHEMVKHHPDKRVLRLWRDGKESVTVVQSATHRLSLGQRIKRLPVDIGWKAPLISLVLAFVGSTLLAPVAVLGMTQNVLGAVVAAVVMVAGWWIYLNARLAKQLALFETQFMDALQLVSRSLRAGHPVLGAFQLAAEEMDEPVKAVLQDVCQQQQLGVRLEEALTRASISSPSDDFRFFAVSISIASRSGGSLADMIDRLVHVIRERMRLGRRVRVLTSQAQFSKRVLLTLPFLLALAIHVLNPGSMEPLHTMTEGYMLAAIGMFNMLAGAWMMNRLAQLQY